MTRPCRTITRRAPGLAVRRRRIGDRRHQAPARAEGIHVLSVRTARWIELAFQRDGPTLASSCFSWSASRAPCSPPDRCCSRSQSSPVSAPCQAVACARSACRGVPSYGRWPASSASPSPPVSSPAPSPGSPPPGSRCHRCPSSPDCNPARPSSSNCRAVYLVVVVGAAALLLAIAAAVSIAVVNAASTPDKLRISQR